MGIHVVLGHVESSSVTNHPSNVKQGPPHEGPWSWCPPFFKSRSRSWRLWPPGYLHCVFVLDPVNKHAIHREIKQKYLGLRKVMGRICWRNPSIYYHYSYYNITSHYPLSMKTNLTNCIELEIGIGFHDVWASMSNQEHMLKYSWVYCKISHKVRF